MKKIYKILSILYLNINLYHHNLYSSSHSKSFNYGFDQHFYFLKKNRSNTQTRTHNENSEFSINPRMLKKRELEKLISSTITRATEIAQSLGIKNQPFNDEDILKLLQKADLPVYAINNYLNYIKNEPNNLDIVVSKAYKSGKDYASTLNKNNLN